MSNPNPRSWRGKCVNGYPVFVDLKQVACVYRDDNNETDITLIGSMDHSTAIALDEAQHLDLVDSLTIYRSQR